MNLRNWTKGHTIGLLIGIGTTLIAIPIVVMILGAVNDYPFSRMWYSFTTRYVDTRKVLSLAAIANLFWFHYFLRRQKWGYGMGIILATILNLFAIL